ncbi:MAG TPA: zinc ribbon domain-containing protein [Clostridiaceae bacterium]|nr:zinc ribbon domain-containing protein [Clostridiaceae bacterium]
MFCANCGNKLPEGAKFCGGCGVKTEPVQPDYTVSEKSAPMRPAPPPPINTPLVQTASSHQQAYAPLQSTAYSGQLGDEPLRVGQYIGMFLLMCVPILNIILLFVWGFGSSANLNKKNFARAALILCAIMLIFWIVAGGIIRNSLGSIIGGYY